jgi:hypothetical protein
MELATAAAYIQQKRNTSEACMTRAVVFLAAAMVAASLGVVAQDVSTGTHNPTSQSQSGSNGQVTPNSAPAAHESAPPATTGNDKSGVQDSAPGEEAPANDGQLPQTSTILPLLGLIGLGSLVAGFFARR